MTVNALDCGSYREAHVLIEEINGAVSSRELRKYRAQFNAAELLVIDDLFLRKRPVNAGDELADVGDRIARLTAQKMREAAAAVSFALGFDAEWVCVNAMRDRMSRTNILTAPEDKGGAAQKSPSTTCSIPQSATTQIKVRRYGMPMRYTGR